MKRRIIGAMLSLVVLVSALAGCGSNSQTSQSESATGSENANTSSSELKDGVDTEITIVYPGSTSAPGSLAAVEEGINSIISETIDAHVKFNILEWGVYNEQKNLMLSSGEAVDVVFIIGASSIQTSAKSGQIIDIADYTQQYGQDATAVLGDYIDGCYVGDALYGWPTYHEYAQGGGLVCSTELLNETGYAAEDIKTWEDVEAVCAKVKELHSDIDVLVPPESQSGMLKYYWGGTFDKIVTDMAGVYNDGRDGLTVHNIYDTEEFLEVAKKAYEWNQNNWFIADSNTITEARQTFLKAKTAFGYIGLVHPGTLTQETTNAGIDITTISINQPGCGTNDVAAYQYCVAASSDSPAKAVAVLNMIYSNPDIQNYIRYGIEGSDYEMKSETVAGYPEGVSAETAGWLNELWVTGNGSLTYAWETDPADIWDSYMEFNNTATFSPAYGFSYDASGVKTEITAVQNVLDKYLSLIYSGLGDPEETVEAFNSELQAAGMDVIVADVQTQLDEWSKAE
ncbi:MAG: ABC transporter substrate-binding protein [Lachnospiraceae bacterium]